MSKEFLSANKLTRVIDRIAAGSSDETGGTIDMKGFENVTFIVGFGTIVSAAVTGIRVEQGAASGMGDATDLEGSAIGVADDDDTSIVAIEIIKPRERYLRVVVDRATQNAEIDFGLAIQSGPRAKPVTHDADTVLGSETHTSPAEGTA